MILTPMMSMIFSEAKPNSSSPYTLTNNILLITRRIPKIVIQTAEFTAWVQNSTITAAATISAGKDIKLL